MTRFLIVGILSLRDDPAMSANSAYNEVEVVSSDPWAGAGSYPARTSSVEVRLCRGENATEDFYSPGFLASHCVDPAQALLNSTR